jgi:type II secretory pathway component HofQ
VAYLLHDSGGLWEVKAGQRLFDGVVERVDGDALEFRGEGSSGDSQAKPVRTRVKLFEKGEPAPQAFDPKQNNGEPLSIDLDADVASFAGLMAQFSGLNVALEAGTSGRVRIVARNAPWDALIERGLKSGGFGMRLDRGYLRIGRLDQMKKMRPLSSREWSGQPVSLSFTNADLRDVLRLFADISGRAVDVLPPEPYEPLTIFVQDEPWDELFELIVASHGWTYRIDGKHLRVEVPKDGL